MRPSATDRRMLAAIMAAGAAMALCFALRSTAATFVDQIPRQPPAAVQRAGGDLMDINTAGLEELTGLPGIGQARAQAILDDREANGPYRYPEDLIRVKGIGETTLSGILDQITAGSDGNAENIGG